MSIIASPLRYPGGKSALTPFLTTLLGDNNLLGGVYAEPYAGGAGAAIKLLLDGAVRRIILNDADKNIYSFWNAVLHHTEDFLRLLWTVPVTVEEWHRQKSRLLDAELGVSLERGFAAFFLNRCNRSGILMANPIGGLEQKGEWKLDVRFTRTGLAQRIEKIALRASDIELHCLDALKFLAEMKTAEQADLFVFLDPPYHEKGGQLYLNAYGDEDHRNLARFLSTNRGFNWVMTYDDTSFIRSLYREGFTTATFAINYFAQRKRVGTELLVLPPWTHLHGAMPALVRVSN
ncbi:DNA adenine methylase [Nitratidesulfovibrio sp. D1]|uniref:DNA adenine methylase n=1 Tax=Nitratidesulfovibrio sp. D1 TaxID=3440151 RepID=UPI003EBF0E2C